MYGKGGKCLFPLLSDREGVDDVKGREQGQGRDAYKVLPSAPDLHRLLYRANSTMPNARSTTSDYHRKEYTLRVFDVCRISRA